MGWGLVALAAGTVASGALSADASRKAAHAANDAAKASQVDIDKLDAQTRRIALQNAQDSAALEKAMTPEVPQLRSAANNAVIAGLNDSSSDNYRRLLESKLGASLDTPLLKDAIAKARADLSLGGTLSKDVQNAVTRRGLATAGTVGPGLGLGRDVVARDLGLTSLGLEQSRLAAALQGGAQEQSLATDNSSNLLNQIQILQSIASGKKNYALGAANYGQSIAQPIVGLDPGAVAGAVGNNATNASGALSNKANIYGAQSQGYAQLAGQLGATYGLLAYSGGKGAGAGSNTLPPASSLPAFNYKL